MKTSNVLASLFFGSLAAAAPVNKRDMKTETKLVVETVVVYTTVWDQGPSATAAAQATSEAGHFRHRHSHAAASSVATSAVAASSIAVSSAVAVVASSAAVPTSVYTPPVVEASSVYTPVPSSAAASSVYTPAPSSVAPSSVYTPAPAPSSAAAPSSVVAAPSSVVVAPSSAAPAPAQSSAPATNAGSGQTYHGDITIYDNTGAAGACGQPITDGSPVVALSQALWGASTYDVMTGAATNPWCGQKITISYKGKTVDATIMDMCPGCSGSDIDLSYSVWKEVTGTDEKTRLQADWWKAE